MDAGKLIEEYVTLREGREVLKEKYTNHDTRLKTRMEEIEESLFQLCKETNVESLSSPVATAYRTVQTRYWSGNWDVFKDFVIRNNAVDLLERRVHQTNMKQWIDEAEGKVPEGLNIDQKYKIIVRKK